MKIPKMYLGALLCVLPIIGLFCVGGTSESGNARSIVCGSIVESGAAVSGAKVQLVADGFVPGTDTLEKVFTTRTDEGGGYRFDEIPKGLYYLNARSLGKRLLRGPVGIMKPSEDLSVDSLQPTAKLTISVPETSGVDVVFIQGLATSLAVHSHTVGIDSAPCGAITVMGCSQAAAALGILNSNNSKQQRIDIAPSDTLRATFDNAPPRWINLENPQLRIIVGIDSQYDTRIIADDLENDSIRFSFIAVPSGMVIDSLTGKITWPITSSVAVGVHSIGVLVTDIKGASCMFWWTVVVEKKQVLNYVDSIAPIITLLGSSDTAIIADQNYIDPGFIAFDNVDGEINDRVKVSGSVELKSLVVDTIYYNVSDLAGNTAKTKMRIVRVYGRLNDGNHPYTPCYSPKITLLGKNPDTVFIGETWKEPGYTVEYGLCYSEDVKEMDTTGLGAAVEVHGGPVVTTTEKIFTLMYTTKDTAGNAVGPWTRTVVVIRKDTVAPIITLIGSSDTVIGIRTGDYGYFVDPGFEAFDDIDTAIYLKVRVTDCMDAGKVGDSTVFYKAGIDTISYSVSDVAGNKAATKTRIVRIIPNNIGDPFPPEIVLLGKNPDTVHIGEVWKESGYTVWSYMDTTGLGAAVVVTGGPVVTTTEKFFELVYTVKDKAGNSSLPKVRIVVVIKTPNDTINGLHSPSIELYGKNPDTVQVGSVW